MWSKSTKHRNKKRLLKEMMTKIEKRRNIDISIPTTSDITNEPLMPTTESLFLDGKKNHVEKCSQMLRKL